MTDEALDRIYARWMLFLTGLCFVAGVVLAGSLAQWGYERGAETCQGEEP